MYLGSEEIRKLIKTENLISDYINLEEQIQPNGFDLTLNKIEVPTTPGVLGVKGKTLPVMKEIKPIEIISDKKGFSEKIFLPKGIYLGYLNETVNLKSVAAICIQRSTLARSGVFHPTSLWDKGYNGKGTVALVVDNPNGFYMERNSRIVQMIFSPVLGDGFAYNGNYQGENIKKVSK
jgi:dUTP pyrophosphatase